MYELENLVRQGNQIDREWATEILGARDFRRCPNNIFFLGVMEPRLTILSQQCRALDLVAALHEADLIRTNGVCVIGAGVGGITAAAALGTLNCHVTLLERALGPMHLQESNDTRWLHPNVYRWPLEGWDSAKTELPFLNWRAGMAGKVIRDFARQWRAMRIEDNLEELVAERYGVGHIEILSDNRKPYVIWSEPGKGYEKHAFDAVILAIGFGLEKRLSTVPWRSYWRNDSLNQPIPCRDGGGSRTRYCISGCGDGGLIDLIRLCIRECYHDTLIEDFFPAVDPATEALVDSLRAIRSSFDKPEATESGPWLEHEFQTLLTSWPTRCGIDRVLERIKDRLRTDTEITLHGQHSSPLSTRVSLLHSFLTWCLRRCGVRYVHEANASFKRRGKRWLMNFGSGNRSPLQFDSIIVRHGQDASVLDEFSDLRRSASFSRDSWQTPSPKPNEFTPRHNERFIRARRWCLDFNGIQARLRRISESVRAIMNLEMDPNDFSSKDPITSNHGNIIPLPRDLDVRIAQVKRLLTARQSQYANVAKDRPWTVIRGVVGCGKTSAVLHVLLSLARSPSTRIIFVDFTGNRDRPLKEGAQALGAMLRAIPNNVHKLAICIDGLDAACRDAALAEPFGPRGKQLFVNEVKSLNQEIINWLDKRKSHGKEPLPRVSVVCTLDDDCVFRDTPMLDEVRNQLWGNLKGQKVICDLTPRKSGVPLPLEQLLICTLGDKESGKTCVEIISTRSEIVRRHLASSANILYDLIEDVKLTRDRLARLATATEENRKKELAECIQLLAKERDYMWYSLIVNELRQIQITQEVSNDARNLNAILGLRELVKAVFAQEYAPEFRQTGVISNILSLANGTGVLDKVLSDTPRSNELTGLNLQGSDFRNIKPTRALRLAFCDITSVKWPQGRKRMPVAWRKRNSVGNYQFVRSANGTGTLYVKPVN